MIDIRTGREMTRRDFGKGLAAIIGAGVAPSIALGATRIVSRTPMLAGSANGGVARGMMRNVGARNAAMFGGVVKTYDVQDYVGWGTQNLIGMFDGIRNAGATSEHSSSATVWKNIATNLNSPTFTGASFESNNLRVPSLSSITLGNGNQPRTVEAIFSTEISDAGGVLAFIDMNKRMCLGAIPNGFATGIYQSVPYDVTIGDVHSLSATYASGANSASIVFVDGKEVSGRSRGNFSNPTSWNWCIGGVYSRKFQGNVYAIRIYDIELTAQQIAANYAIDKARFNLP